MLIIDGDYPMAYGGVDLDRDLTLPIDEVRSASDRRSLSGGWPDSETMASLPEMRKGGVAAALVKVVGRIRRPNSPIWGYRTGHGAYAAAQAHLAYYEVLAAEGEARVLATSADFAAHMREWSEAEDHSALPVGFIIGMEGADPILWPEQVHEWWERGLRVISLSHYGVSTYSHGTGTGTEGGLPSRGGAPEGYGQPRHDPRRDPHLRPLGQGGDRDVRRPAPGEPPELPRREPR